MDITAGVETRPSGSTPRTRTALFGAFLSLVMITSIVVFAIQADGREGTESSTNDGGAWLVNQRAGSIGHVNRTVRELSAAVRVSQPLADFDVYQPHGIVAVHDRTVNTLEVVDERVHLSTNSVDVPKDLDVRGHENGLVIQANSPYRIWNVSSGQLAEIGSLQAVTPIYEGDSTVFGVSASGAVLVAESNGNLLLIGDGLPETILGSTLTDSAGNPRPVEHVMFDGDQGLVTIGSRIGVIDEGQVRLLEDEIDPWLQAGEPSATRTGSLVVVTRDQRVVRIDTTDGSARSLGRLNSSRVVPPIEHKGCVYALTNEPAEYWVQCGSDPSRTSSLPGQNTDLRLRLVNGWIWINDVATGNLWFVDDDFELSPIDDWGAVLPRNESTDESELPPTDGQDNVVTDVENPDAEDSEIIDADEFDEDGVNQPPVAFDDLDVRVPQGRPAVVNVVGNDTDPDNDVLLIAAVVNESGSDANITASPDGTRIQVTPAPDFVGVIRYSYTIADGRGGSDTADGSVVVVQNTGESNRPPVAVTDIAAITAGDRLILNVVANDTDPDGDSLVLVDASAPNGTISFDPSGQIIFEPASTSEDGEIELTYVISDDFGERVEGIARVLVRLKESNQPPDARNDGAITVVGQPITINVLANDVDPDGDDLFVAQRPALLSPAGVDVFTTISPDGEFVMIPDAPGTYIFSYAASDDEASDIAQIRIEVNEAEGNRPPVALRDDVVVPTGSSRLVYALANDSDPDGDVIGIVDLAVPPGSGMRVERFLDIGFRVFVDGPGPSRRTFSYSISDGKAPPVRTTVVVAVAETTSRNNPPVAEPDTIEVRAGTSVTVAVLDNDFDPEGGTLRVVAVSSNDGAQTSIGPDGQSVRLTVLPETTTSFTLNYDVVDDQQNRTASIIRVRVVPAGEANRPPIARPDDARTRFEEPVNIVVIANDSDPDGDPIRVESITVQPSFGTVTIDQASGEVIYLPARGFSGTDRFSYTITDALGARSTGEVLVGVLEAPAPNRDPIATDDSFLTIATGQQISLTVLGNDSDPDGDQLAISSMGGVSVGEATIVPERTAIDYIAPIDQPNDVTVTFDYTISDRNGGSATATITVLVQATPPLPDGVTLPPIAADDFVGPVTSGTPLRIDVVDNDRDPDTDQADLTVELAELGTSADGADIGAIVDGQTITLLAPDESTEFSYQLIDADGNIGSATVFITVVNPVAPVAVDDSAGPVKQGDIVIVEALLNDFDPDGEPTALEIVSVSGAEASTDGSTISIQAPEASSQYTYTIRDADELESTAVVSLIVTENRAPTVEASAFSTDFGESIEIDLSSTASDPDGDPLLFACCQSARDGSPDVVAAGENQLIVRFTPNDGFSGDAVFTYQVDDQFGHRVAGSTTITVGEQPNREPTAVDGAATIQVPRPGGEPFTVDIDLAALSDDPDGDDLEWSLTTQPGADLTAVINGSTLTLTSTDQSDAGQTSLTWTATDPEAESSEATVTITVEQAQNTAPTASDDSVTVPAGASTIVDLEPLTTDPDTNENLSFEIDAPPTPGLTSTLTGRASVTIAAAVNEVGTTTAITYTVTDRLGEDATATIQVTVGEPNQAPPTASPDTASTLQGQAVDIDVLTNDNDPIGTGLTIVSPGGSTDGTLELVGSAIRFTPTVDFFGTTEFIYTIRDAADTASREATATVSVEVTGRPSVPSPPTCTASSREASLVWTAPTGNGAPVTDYILSYEEADSRVQGSTDITTSGTSATVSPLQNGQGYQFKVQALNIAGASDWSDWSTTCTPDIEPEQPAPPQVTHGDGWLDLTWSEPTNEGSDIIEYDVRIGGGTIQTSTDTNMRWRDLDNGTDYTFRVAARNEAGLSVFSSPSTPEHPSTTPSAPVIGVTTRAGLIGASASGILQVNWTPVPTSADGGDTVNRYRIERRNGTDVTVTGANASNYVWSGLDNGTPQEFRVFAENRDGESSPSAWSSAVEACTVPDAPTSASAVEGDTTATVSFGDPFDDGGCDVSTYDIRILGETTNVATVPASGSHPVSGLLNAIPVAFEIRAVNVIGNGPWVATNSVTPAGLPICNGNPQQGQIRANDASIYFTPANFNGGADLGYEFNINGAGWVTQSTSDVSGSRYATFVTPPNTSLTVQIRALNQIGSAGCGSISFLSCSPDPPAPAAPTQSGSLIFRDIRVNWTTPTIPCHSQVQSHTDTAIRHYEVDPDPGAPFEETGLTHLITHVNLGTPTRTRVRACDIDSCGAWSSWSSDVTLPTSVQVQLNFAADPDFYPVTGLSITDYDVSRDLQRTTIFGRVNSQGFINAPLPATDPNLPAGSIQYDTLFATYNGEPVCFGYRFDNFFDAGQSINGVGVFGC